MKIKKIVVGDLLTNCYVLISGNIGVIIDPGAEPEKIYEAISDLRIEYILLTHAHFDHVLGIKKLKELLPETKIVLHSRDFKLYEKISKQLLEILGIEKSISLPYPDLLIRKQENLKLDNSKIEIISTPGHTQGSVSYFINNSVFAGDLVFKGGFLGRTDLEGGSSEDINKSVKKILKLPDSTIVYPGHDENFTVKELKDSLNKKGGLT